MKKMKAKLIKTQKGYHIDTSKLDGIHLACYPHSIDKQKLSLKNCQAIERGYDLDELADEYYKQFDNLPVIRYNAYTAGFQKALEILGDKKFSEEDILKTIELSREGIVVTRISEWETEKEFDYNETKIIQSLQQTEWDVVIVTEVVPDLDSRTEVDGQVFSTNKKEVVKLDADGNLILKRK